MFARYLAGLIVGTGLLSAAVAQDGPTLPPQLLLGPPPVLPHVIEARPLPYVRPLGGARPVTAELPPPPSSDEPLDTAGHLRQAAAHLEAAGLPEEASRFRERARQADCRQRLEQKLAELKKLQAEVDDLLRQADLSRQVQLSVQLLELTPEAMRIVGLAPADEGDTRLAACLSPEPHGDGLVLNPEQSRALQERLTELGEKGQVKTLGEPKLVTNFGRSAHILAGGEFPIPQGTNVAFREFGTRVDAMTSLLGNGKLRLQVQAEVSERDLRHKVRVGEYDVPGLTTRRINTEIEMPAGHTCVLGGMRAVRQTAAADGAATPEASELLVLVTAELVERQMPVESVDSVEQPDFRWFPKSELQPVPEADDEAGDR